jgi:hypothetical protein
MRPETRPLRHPTGTKRLDVPSQGSSPADMLTGLRRVNATMPLDLIAASRE